MNKKELIKKLIEVEDLIRDIKTAIKEMPDIKASDEKKEGEEDEGEKRNACPDCGSLNFTESTNKDKVIYYSGGMPIYAKKYTCNKCGKTWSS
ncbi:MAG: hypothetical protein ACFFCS_27485 [Candidatus Hodarchaeota archaeon]